MNIYNKNMGHYFLKERTKKFYLSNDKKNKAEIKKEDYEIKIIKTDTEEDLLFSKFQKISLMTNYPGLLIGTGTSIELTEIEENQKIKSNFKSGLSFDYTSGLPYIPGSSLKGVLRSFFPTINNKEAKEITEAKVELLNELAGKNFDVETWKELTAWIFEGELKKRDKIIKLPMKKRDKFIEGRISLNSQQEIILAEDYITPHKEILKDPTPIQILKVTSGIQIDFFFELYNNHCGENLLTKETKLKLFEKILYLIGIGAKTNTGYGHFDANKGEKIKAREIEKVEKLKKERIKQKKEAEERLKKLEEERIRKEKEKFKSSMTEEEKFLYEFKNEWNEEEIKSNYQEFLKFEVSDKKKEIAKIYLEYFKREKKPSKKTEKKLEYLEELLK